MRLGSSTDKKDSGRLHVDFAQARDDFYEWECRQRMRAREERHRRKLEEDRLRPPSPPAIMHYSEHEAALLAEKLKGGRPARGGRGRPSSRTCAQRRGAAAGPGRARPRCAGPRSARARPRRLAPGVSLARLHVPAPWEQVAWRRDTPGCVPASWDRALPFPGALATPPCEWACTACHSAQLPERDRRATRSGLLEAGCCL